MGVVTESRKMAPDHFCLLVAIWEFLFGASLLVQRQDFLSRVERFTQDTPKVRWLMSAWLLIGALAVKENPYPAADLLGVLSILAWVTMIKCAMGVLWTAGLIQMSLRFLRGAHLGIGCLQLLISGALFYAYSLL